MIKTKAIILCSGKGTRAGFTVPKQFAYLHNYPVIYYIICTTLECSFIDDIYLVILKEYKTIIDNILTKFFSDAQIKKIHILSQNYLKFFKLSKRKKNRIIITGDFNYDLLTYTKNEKVNEFITLMYENLFQPCILQPTRVNDYQRPTLIDNIFVNEIDVTISGNLIDKISDHFPNFVVIENEGIISKSDINHYKRNMADFNAASFTNALTTKFAQTNYESQNSNELSKNIVDTFIKTLDSIAPMRKMSRKEVKNNQKPWLTRGILNSVKIKTK